MDSTFLKSNTTTHPDGPALGDDVPVDVLRYAPADLPDHAGLGAREGGAARGAPQVVHLTGTLGRHGALPDIAVLVLHRHLVVTDTIRTWRDPE